MESLAALVTLLLGGIYGAGVISLALCWSRNRIVTIISRVFAFISMAAGFWLGLNIMSANGLLVGGIPVLLGTASLVISIRRNR